MKGMKITEFKTEELIPYINNPRNNDEAVDYVAASIKEFGFRQPIIIDKDKVIVAGHTRLKAAKKLGLETVPCVMADDLTEHDTPNFEKMKKEELVEYIQKIYEYTTIIYEDKPTKSELHPTMKPISLFARLIKNSSKRAEKVMDLFGGSGTTIIACEQLGRQAFVMEYDERYASNIIRRWEEFTGKKAEILSK